MYVEWTYLSETRD